MGDARAVFTNAAALAGAQLIERITSIALTFVLARALGAEGLGIYSGALAFFALIAVGGQLGATTFLVREISRDRSKAAEYLVHLGLTVAAVSGLLAGAVALVVPHLGLSSTLTSAILLVLLAVVPGTMTVMQEGVFIAFQRTYIQTVITFGASALNLGVSIALLIAGYGVIPVLGVYVAVQFLTAIGFFIAINLWLTRVRARFRVATARRLLGQMKAFIGSSALGALFSRPEIILLTVISSEAQIGYYAAALKVVDVWYFIPATFAMNVYPLMSRSFVTGRRRLQEIQDKSLRFLMAFSLPVTVATFVFAEPLVDLLYGEDLAPAVDVLHILALNVCLYALFELLWRVLSARNEQGAVLRVQAVTTVTRLGGGVALIVPFAAVGAAINMVANTVLHIVLLALRVRTDGTRVALGRIAARPAAAAVLMGGLGWLLLPAIGFVPAVACAVTAYLLLAVGIGAVSRDDVEFLRRRARAL